MNRITATQSFFLSVLSDYLNGRPSFVPDGLDIDNLKALADMQQLSSVIYNQVRIPDFQAEFAENSYYYSYCNTVRKNYLNKIDTIFRENGIPYLLFKGTEIAKYYPNPLSRSMGDSDILVHSADKKRAHDALLSIGLENQKQGYVEWIYHKYDIQFELHHRLLYDEVVNEKYLQEWTDTVWEHSASKDGIRYSLELEYHLVYLIIHLRKHFLNAGVGFRQFMDLAVVARQELDWNKVKVYLNSLKLMSFAQVCYALIERWFHVNTPITGTVTDEFCDSATGKILANGIFGCEDETNRGNKISNTARKYGKFGCLIINIFPPYEDMGEAESYRFLRGRPYLLPVAWIYRWCYVIVKKKAKAGIKEVLKPFAEKEQFSRREEILRQWGLL